MKFCALLMVLVAGCSFEKDTFVDGGGDGGDLGAGVDCGLPCDPAFTHLCTTAACAQSPCTAGCVFAAPACTNALPSLVDTATVTACSGFCGQFIVGSPNGLGCGVYNGSKPGCATCGSSWGAASCVDVNPMIDYQYGGAICQNTTCFNGTPPQDASVNCDMYPRD
jgi:hypothetical protein